MTTSRCFIIIDLPWIPNNAVSVSMIPFFKWLGQVDALVPLRKAIKDTIHLVAMFLIKVWCLKTECIQISIPSAALPGFLFSCQ